MSNLEEDRSPISRDGVLRRARDYRRILSLEREVGTLNRRVAELEIAVTARDVALSHFEASFADRLESEMEQFIRSEGLRAFVRQWGLEYAVTTARYCRALVELDHGRSVARVINVPSVTAFVDGEISSREDW